MKTCTVPGCNRPHDARGYCSPHYKRWLRHGDPLAGGTPKGELQRFMTEVVLPFQGDDCLIWPYGKKETGYGSIFWEGKTLIASRLICTIAHGEPPTPEHQAAHSCGKGHEGCVNPKHLRWATQAENFADQLIHGTRSSGERNGQAKLTANEVQEIRQLNGTMSQREIAARFNVHPSTVSSVLNGMNWSGLDQSPCGMFGGR
jgi:hypothetical protein